MQSVRFSPDSRLIVAAGIDGAIRLWTIDGKLSTIFKGHKSAVWRVAFSPDGQTIASASGDFSVKLWQLDGTLIITLKHERGMWGIAFSPDGKTLASEGDDQLVILWDLEQILHLNLLKYSCDWVQDYLKTNITVEKSDRSICNYSLFH
ncbi:MAG: WD40 repeat domain-containing protein [Nostoc sp.]